MSGVQTLTVAEGDGDQRLDRWMRRQFPHLSQGRIEKLCRKGEIRVDGGRIKSSTRVQVGETVRIPPLPDPGDVSSAPVPKEFKITKDDVELMRSLVLWKDDHIIALNKPPGIASQGGSGQTRHLDGLADALRYDRDEKPRLVHRLDKDTSGVFLLARTREIAAQLAEAFKDRETRKIYWAAVAGVPAPDMGTIRYGLLKQGGPGSEKMVCIHPREVEETKGAKRATTDYAILSKLGTRVSWCALVPVTGRTHQLRAHMAEMGHPIVGDGKYGGSGQENQGDGWGASLGEEFGRKLHLHARSISLTHPVTGARLNITAPLPEHMANTWDTLGWQASDVPADPFEEEI